MSKTQFETIINKFPGGVSEVAGVCNISEVSVYRWGYSKEKGGTGGFIPDKYHAPLLEAARLRKYKLKPRDFFAHLDGAALGAAQ